MKYILLRIDVVRPWVWPLAQQIKWNQTLNKIKECRNQKSRHCGLCFTAHCLVFVLFETGSHSQVRLAWDSHVAQAGLKLSVILLPHTPKC